MKKIIVLFILFVLFNSIYGQTDTVYCNTFGGIQNDGCNQVKATYDGGYIMVGTTNSFGCGNTNIYVIKTDSLLHHVWSRTYGGASNQEGFGAIPTSDRGYAFVGLTDSYGNGGYDVLLVKTDSAGNEQWEKTYGGPDWDFGYSIQQLSDKGFVICGQTYSYGPGNGNVFIIRTDSIGDTLWTRAVGGDGFDVGYSLCIFEDSIYAITGATTSFGKGDTDVLFILINNNGVVEKEITYGSTRNDIGYSINRTLDKGFVIFGCTDSVEHGTPNEMMIKTDSSGILQWMQIYPSSDIKPGIGHDALQAPDSTFLAVSTSNAYGIGGYAMRIWHFDINGGPSYSAPSQGGTGDQQGCSVTIGKNGNVVFAGASNSPAFTEGLYDVMMIRTTSDTIVDSYEFVKLNNHDTSFCVTGINTLSVTMPGVKIFPNPVFSCATFLVQGELGSHYSLDIFNMEGERIAKGIPFISLSHGQSCSHFEKGNLPTGVYMYIILNQSGVTVSIGKFIIL